MRRRGKSQSGDLSHRRLRLSQTGEPQWEITEDIFGTWLGYSEEQDLLLQAGAAASDRLTAEVGAGHGCLFRQPMGRWSGRTSRSSTPARASCTMT